MKDHAKSLPLTDAEYVKRPCHCPSCGHDIVEGGAIEVESNQAFQSVSCNACSACWTDIYQLVGYRLEEEGDQ